MRFFPPIYPEDGLLPHPLFPVWGDSKARKSSTKSTDIPQRTIDRENAADLKTDAATLVQQANAARSAFIGSKLKSFYEALVRKFAFDPYQAEMENYLAASQNLADLEDRIRRFERRQVFWDY